LEVYATNTHQTNGPWRVIETYCYGNSKPFGRITCKSWEIWLH